MMPKQVLFTFLIETVLILATTLLLAQPEMVFSGQAKRVRSLAKAGGLILLCLTFCWSVVLGAVITLYSAPL